MNRAPSVLANLCLAFAAMLLLPVGIMVFEARRVTGEYAMGLVVVPMLELVQWVLLTGALVLAARRERLSWLHHARSVPIVVGAAWLALLGVAATVAVFMAYDPITSPFRLWSVTLALVLPLFVVIVLGALVNSTNALFDARTWRAIASALSLMLALGAGAMFRVAWAQKQQHEASRAVADSVQSDWETAQRKRFAALSNDAPLIEWLPWLETSISELQQQALAAVRRRPTLTTELTSMLRSDRAPVALRFMWLWLPNPPVELAAPTRDAITTLSAWAERRLAAPRTSPIDTTRETLSLGPHSPEVGLDEMAQAAIVLADAFRSSGLDFVAPIRSFNATLQQHALPESQLADDDTYQPRAYVTTWLETQRK